MCFCLCTYLFEIVSRKRVWFDNNIKYTIDGFHGNSCVVKKQQGISKHSTFVIPIQKRYKSDDSNKCITQEK